jgi:hypothetical protein
MKEQMMVNAQPEGEPHVVEYEFRYKVSNQYIEEALDQEGLEVSAFWKISFELRDLPTPELRRKARAVRRLWSTLDGYPEVAAPTEDPIEFVEAAERWVQEAGATLDDPQSHEDLRSARSAEFEETKNQWIAMFGSTRLRRANDRGYKVNRLYAQERLAAEFPTAWLDTSAKSIWRERTDPTEEALDLEDDFASKIQALDPHLEVKIVWLVSPPPELRETYEVPGLEWDSQEAILIRPYLGRYSLYVPVDPTLWKTTRLGDGS